jgi:hypothetical protein
MLTNEELYPRGCFGELDHWLQERVQLMLPAMQARPGASFNALFETHRERMGAYRMCEHEEVTLQRLLQPPAQAVGERIAQGQWGDRVLSVHDRTECNETALAASMKGLGEIGNPKCRGFFLQTALALDTQGVALGVLSAQTWIRPEGQHGKAQQRKVRAFEDKESARWWHGIEQAEQRVGRAGVLRHIIDAEGDIYELFERAQQSGVCLLVRAAQQRRVEPEGYLWQAMEAMPEAGRREVAVPARPAREGQPARSARTAELTLRYGPVRVKAPRTHGQQGTLELWALLVREHNAPLGEEPLEWLLLTNEPLLSVEHAWHQVDCYLKRWKIEEFHKCLKTGCRVERRPFEAREHLENALALLMLVSVQLLALTTLARVEPEMPADLVLEPEELQVLRLQAPLMDAPALSSQPTVAEVVPLIARLGGYMARRSDGPPGWLTLWRGYQRLQLMVDGFVLARSLAPSLPLRV